MRTCFCGQNFPSDATFAQHQVEIALIPTSQAGSIKALYGFQQQGGPYKACPVKRRLITWLIKNQGLNMTQLATWSTERLTECMLYGMDLPRFVDPDNPHLGIKCRHCFKVFHDTKSYSLHAVYIPEHLIGRYQFNRLCPILLPEEGMGSSNNPLMIPFMTDTRRMACFQKMPFPLAQSIDQLIVYTAQLHQGNITAASEEERILGQMQIVEEDILRRTRWLEDRGYQVPL